MKIKIIVVIVLLFIISISISFAEESEGTLALTFTGDIMAHDVNFNMKDYNKIYERVKKYFETDDLTFGNLETPVNNDLPYATYPMFNVQEPYVRAAVDAGFDVFSLANNHTNDKGDIGVLKTMTALMVLKDQSNGNLFFSGIRTNTSKPFTPEVIYKNGFKIGFLAVTQFLNSPQKEPYVHVVNINNESIRNTFLAEIEKTAKEYDLFIVSFHGDVEYVQTPNKIKQQFFHDLVHAGVDIVWGHHPHVLQPYEVVEAENTKRLIMYSTGNFISGQTYGLGPDKAQHSRALTGDSAIFQVTIKRDEQKRVSVETVSPVYISVYKTPESDIIVDTLESLASSKLPGTWQAYYQTRLKIISDFFDNMKNYIN